MSLSGGVDALAARIAQEVNNLRASAVKTYAQTLSTSATSYNVTHGLGTRDVTVQIYQTTTPYETVWATIERTTLTAVTIRFATAPTAGSLRVVVQGQAD
jgi:hypothetical protein